MKKLFFSFAAGAMAFAFLLLLSGRTVLADDEPGDQPDTPDDVVIVDSDPPGGGEGDPDVPGDTAGIPDDPTDPGDGGTEPPDPATTALDADGNPYPAGGPPGLYGSIIDKQNKTMDGGGSPGNANALSKLRRNLSRWLEKKGISGDLPDTDVPGDNPDDVAGDPPDTDVPEASAPTKPLKAVNVDRAPKPEKIAKPDKVAKPEKPEIFVKPEKVVKPEKIAKPEKVAKPEKAPKPERPIKIAKPFKPEKPKRPNK